MGKEAVGLCHSCRCLLIKCRRDLIAGHVIVAVLHPRHGDGDCLGLRFRQLVQAILEKECHIIINPFAIIHQICVRDIRVQPLQFFQCHAVGFRCICQRPVTAPPHYLQGDTVLRQNDQILQPGCRCVRALYRVVRHLSGHLCTPLLQTYRMLFRCSSLAGFCSTVRRGIISRFCCWGRAGRRRFFRHRAHLRPTASGEQHGTGQNSSNLLLLHNVSLPRTESCFS